MPLNIDYDIIENRLKQGLAAGIGTFAMVAVTSFRISQERGFIASPSSVFKFSAIASAIAGAIWASMPAAKENPSETVEKAKEHFYPAFKVGLKRIIDNEEILQGDIDRAVKSSRESSTSYTSSVSRSTYATSPSKSVSLSRINKRYGFDRNRSRGDFDNGFEGTDLEEEMFTDRDIPFVDDDDILSDSEVEEMLRDSALDDPFYEGPTSPFNRV